MGNNEYARISRISSEILEGNIIPFWLQNGPDNKHGGFHGRVTNDLRIEEKAPKSLILLTRILWTFSALYKRDNKSDYLQMADRAYSYLLENYIDTEYGGAYWMVDYLGKPLNIHKKIYGQAFTIYALAEYFDATANTDSLMLAKEIFSLVEKHNFDAEYGGYFEMSGRNWSLAKMMQLSDSDMIEDKSMNTHLHLLEAYSSLFRVWPDNEVEKKLEGLINNFSNHIFNPDNHHFHLFFNRKWEPQTSAISFGHDIEGSWLLTEAVEVLGDLDMDCRVEKITVDLVNAVIDDGFNENGGIYSEKTDKGEILDHIDWWQQVEAIVGFLNAFMITGEKQYMDWVAKSCSFIDKYFLDKKYGEWYYEVSKNGIPNPGKYKISEWKGPYHNSRACMETLDRIKQLEQREFKTGSPVEGKI